MIETRKYRLNSMPRAQCYVEIVECFNLGPDDFDTDTLAPDSVVVTLVSYDTRVLSIVHDYVSAPRSVALFATGTYSNITARHINRFTTEFFGRNLYRNVKEMSAPCTVDILGTKMYPVLRNENETMLDRVYEAIDDYIQSGERYKGYY